MRNAIFLSTLLLFFGCKKEPHFEVDLSGIKVIAHRGGPEGLFPDNSLSAINNALNLNIDGIEIDIRLTKDNQIVLSHDEGIDNTTNGQGKIRHLTLDEIRKFKLLNPQKQETDQVIPTLEEVVRMINGRAELFIELKDDSDFMLSSLTSYIKDNDLYSWVRVISFGKKDLLKINSDDKNIQTGNIVYDATGRIEFRGTDISYLKYLFVDYRALDMANTLELDMSKKLVYVYTLNHFLDLQEDYYSWIDGVITDNPKYWMDLIKRK